jgi:curved DNA-binding protein CbpA
MFKLFSRKSVPNMNNVRSFAAMAQNMPA